MKKEFTHEMTDEIKEIIRKYLDCELIKKDFEKLKKIVNKHCICFNFLKNVEPVRYDSVKIMFLDAEMSNIDFDNAYKKFHAVFKSLPETQLETLNYIGMDENSANIPITLKPDKDIRCIKNTLIHICGASDRNRYKIETYSPFYSYFLFKRSTFTLKEDLNSTEFNKLVGYMNEVKNNINVEKREKDKTYKGLNSTENILLFEYLAERGLGTKYKYYTFMYLQKFIDDFEFEKKIIIPDKMSHYWKQIQFLVNKYIDIDFKETIFGIKPSNILGIYQTDVLKEKAVTQQFCSV